MVHHEQVGGGMVSLHEDTRSKGGGIVCSGCCVFASGMYRPRDQIFSFTLSLLGKQLFYGTGGFWVVEVNGRKP